MRAKSANSIAIPINIRANAEIVTKCKIWNGLAHELWEQHRSDYQTLTSPERVERFYCEMARGCPYASLCRVWEKLSDITYLEEQRCVSCQHYSDSLPGLFAFLLGVQAGDVDRGLAALHRI